MKNSELFEIAKNFEINSKPTEISIIDSGHINNKCIPQYFRINE